MADIEVDEARLAANLVAPRLELRLDRIIREVVGKFKSGSLTQDTLSHLRADWLATNRLLGEIETFGKGGMNG